MASPELIRQITDFRRKERELPQQRDPEEVAQEVAKAKAEQTEADEMFRNMRTDCEDLLNRRGVIKKRLRFGPKYKIFETAIADEEGEEVKVVLISSKIQPAASSEINLMVGELDFTRMESYSFLSLERDHSYIVRLVPVALPRLGPVMDERKRTAGLEDARKWKEVVDALKNQNKINQSSPIEHK